MYNQILKGNRPNRSLKIMSDAPTVDFHGAGGAVGRFEVNDDKVM